MMRRPEFIARHGRCPSGWIGRLIATLMARETSQANQTALDLLQIAPDHAVLEVGFGHGRTLACAAKLAVSGRVAGVDISPAMVAMARDFNRDLVKQGLVELSLIDSPELPFDADSFDRVLSVHTLYFWANPVDHLKEIRRVMKANARIVMGFRPASDQARREFPSTLYTFYDVDEVSAMLASAEFTNIELASNAQQERDVAFVIGTC